MNANLLETAKALPLPERIELFDALWETLSQEGYEPELTAAQVAELDRRLEAQRKNPDDVVPWEQVKADAEAKYRHLR